MQVELFEILKIFSMSWTIGLIFSWGEHSNKYIENQFMIRCLFIIKNKPVSIIAFLWQVLNWGLLFFVIINKLLDILTYEYTMYIYYNVTYYGIYVICVLAIIDGIVYEFITGR